MHSVVALHAGPRVLHDSRGVEPECEGLALVCAQTEPEASELVFRAALRSVVVDARRIVENERARPPGGADARAEIRTVAFEREAPADVVRRLAFVVAAHAVHSAHPEL